MAFTMATWNTLATAYIRPAFYPRTRAELLDSAWRVPALVAYAQTLDVDLLCLQEVETGVFLALQAGLPEYQGSHALKGRQRPDGCATFFRTRSFGILSSSRVEYSDDSGHIAQCILLAHEGKRLTVVNTHLKWDAPKTLRESQWGYRQIVQVLEFLSGDGRVSDGQIVCGDLNVTPDSEVVEALLGAGFNYAHRNSPGISTCNSNSEAKLIDYLFSRGALRAHAVVPPMIDGLTPLPSPQQPSDHVPLVARFDWI
jgi:mRNA deadenylase 3'-5' endonuclease subunit Ccr4